LNIPIGDLSRKLDELSEMQDREIITICLSGGRAYTAAQILTKAGFSKVTVLNGGMLAWHQARQPESTGLNFNPGTGKR
jgi:rhodanese-related sulfurtransferase